MRLVVVVGRHRPLSSDLGRPRPPLVGPPRRCHSVMSGIRCGRPLVCPHRGSQGFESGPGKGPAPMGLVELLALLVVDPAEGPDGRPCECRDGVAARPENLPWAVRRLVVVSQDQTDIDRGSISTEEPPVDLWLSLRLGAGASVTKDEPGEGREGPLGSVSDVRNHGFALAVIVGRLDGSPAVTE